MACGSGAAVSADDLAEVLDSLDAIGDELRGCVERMSHEDEPGLTGED